MKQQNIIFKQAIFNCFLIVTLGLAIASYIYIYIVRGASGNPIRSDGWGYYSYLPAIFDYHDLTFAFSDYGTETEAIWIDNFGNYINKYAIGTAICEFPFFAVVDIVCKIGFKEAATGYSTPYQVVVLVSGLFYFCIGLILLYKILKKYFNDKVTIWTLVSICFGTSLFHYATFDAAFSHIYSFCLITLFIWLTIKIEDGWDSKKIYFFLGICAGLILVTRNPNIIILLFYLLYNVSDRKSFFERIQKILNPKRLLWSILGGILPVVIQCSYWMIAAGKPVIRSYNETETFSWLLPHVVEVLFSVSKGLVFYSPIIGISFIGILLMNKIRIPLWSVVSVVIIHIYITSAWDCWWYGGSYGQRPFVDVYSLYALMLGSVYQCLDNVKLKVSGSDESISFLNIIFPLVIVFIFLSLKFMLAYWHGILPFVDATMEDVLNVFNWNFEEIRNAMGRIIVK